MAHVTSLMDILFLLLKAGKFKGRLLPQASFILILGLPHGSSPPWHVLVTLVRAGSLVLLSEGHSSHLLDQGHTQPQFSYVLIQPVTHRPQGSVGFLV